MTRTALSLLLALLMVLGFGFLAAPQASAAETTVHADHCVCGGKAVGVGNHTTCTTLTGWIALSTDADGNLMMGGTAVPTRSVNVDGTNMPAYMLPAGNFYLAGDITLKYPLFSGARNAADSAWVACETTLCLHGHDLAGSGATGGTGRALTLRAGNATLNITDCAEEMGTISSSVQGGVKGGVCYIRYASTTLNIYGGIIQGCANTSSTVMNGGAIAIYTGNINMYGGELRGGSGKMTGGAVYEDYSLNSTTNKYDGSSTFNLYGGTIVGGDVSAAGGAFRINPGKHVVNVYGGTIRDGKSGSLGGNIAAYGTLNVYGGTISGGTATQKGGNIHVNTTNGNSGTAVGAVNIYGGNISGGSDSVGAGIWVNPGKKYSVTGGNITSAVYMGSTQTLTLNSDLNAQIKLGSYAKSDTIIDLNGFNLSGSITGAYKVYGIDSATRDFSGTSYGVLSSTINSATTLVTTPEQAAFAAKTDYIYVPVSTASGWSFRAVYLGISDAKAEMDAEGNVDIRYTTYIKADTDTLPLITGDNAYGLKIYLQEGNAQTAGMSATGFVAGPTGNTVVVRLTDVMTVNGTVNAAKALAPVKAKAYITVSGMTLEGKEYSNDLQSIVEAMDADYDLLSAAQQQLLVDMYSDYTQDMINWVIPNTKEVANLPETTVSAEQEAALRQQVVDYMYQICTLQWKLREDTLRDCGSTCHNKVTLAAGTFTGMPYTHRSASLEKFLSRLDSDGYLVLQDGETITDIGNDCADAVYWAWSQISSGIRFTLTNNALCYNGTIPVGNYAVIGQVTSDAYTTQTVCENNGMQTMYEAYAMVKMGDGLLRAIPNGHFQMAAADAVVVRNSDGTINGTSSYILIHEQGSKPNATSGTTTSVNTKRTFAQIFNSHYIPVTIPAFTQGADAEQVFICNDADASLAEMAANGFVTSNYRVNSVTLKVTDAANNTVTEVTKFPHATNSHNGNVVNLSVFAADVNGLALTAGEQYTYQITVHAGDADIIAQTVSFTA